MQAIGSTQMIIPKPILSTTGTATTGTATTIPPTTVLAKPIPVEPMWFESPAWIELGGRCRKCV